MALVAGYEALKHSRWRAAFTPLRARTFKPILELTRILRRRERRASIARFLIYRARPGNLYLRTLAGTAVYNPPSKDGLRPRRARSAILRVSLWRSHSASARQ